MKLAVIIIFILTLSTYAWREQRLRANLNGPEGLPAAMYDDEEELAAEDGPMHDYDSPEGEDDDPDLFEMRGWPEPELDDDDDDDDDDMPEFKLEDFGEELEDQAMIQRLYEMMTSYFQTEEKIMNQPGETSDCYALDVVKCEFAAEEYPVVWLVEYDDEPEEYKLTIKQDETPDTEVMRRRLTAKNCGVFNGVLSIWGREISCEIKEYSHIVSIKHIG